MARIRTIKPDHWEDEAWDNVSLQAHLLFIGMKNFADDKGIIRANAVLIKNKVFPTRDDMRTSEIEKWLKELVENCFLVPLEFERKGYYVLDFVNEKIDKPQPSILPDDVIREHSRTFENIPAGEERKGEEKEWKGKEYAREIFFKEILFFFDFNEISHFKNFKLLNECCAALESSGRLENFKNQSKNYIEFKKIAGYAHNFHKFLGSQSKLFDDGAWNAENWEKKLADELAKPQKKILPSKAEASLSSHQNFMNKIKGQQ